MEKLQIRCFALQMKVSVEYLFDGQVLQTGNSVICVELNNNNRMVLYKDIWISALGNILECPQDHFLYKSVYNLCVETSFISSFFCKEKYLMRVPLLFESYKEANALVQVFTQRNLPVSGECLSKKSWKVFQDEIQKAIKNQKKPPH